MADATGSALGAITGTSTVTLLLKAPQELKAGVEPDLRL